LNRCSVRDGGTRQALRSPGFFPAIGVNVLVGGGHRLAIGYQIPVEQDLDGPSSKPNKCSPPVGNTPGNEASEWNPTTKGFNDRRVYWARLFLNLRAAGGGMSS